MAWAASSSRPRVVLSPGAVELLRARGLLRRSTKSVFWWGHLCGPSFENLPETTSNSGRCASVVAANQLDAVERSGRPTSRPFLDFASTNVDAASPGDHRSAARSLCRAGFLGGRLLIVRVIWRARCPGAEGEAEVGNQGAGVAVWQMPAASLSRVRHPASRSARFLDEVGPATRGALDGSAKYSVSSSRPCAREPRRS